MSSELLTQQRNIRRSPSVEKFRNCVRKQYKEKLREGRNNEFNRRRHVYRTTLQCVHETLSADERMIVEAELLNTEEILTLFDEIEHELKYQDSLYQAQQYNLYEEQETNSILDNLLDNCKVCDKLVPNQINNNTICMDCATNYFNNENF